MTNIDERQNLRNLFGPVRDQGARPTCLAFAVSDLHAALRDAWAPLSCEFVFYHAQRRAGRPPTVGATVQAMFEALRHDGQPQERGWRYLAATPKDVELWKPPQDVGGIYHRSAKKQEIVIDEMIDTLDLGQPLLVLMYLSASFYLVGTDGFVDPPPSEKADVMRRHAVVAIGHGAHRGRRAILIRNSWGDEWGQSGYAWLAEEYLIARMFGLATLMEHMYVTSPTDAN